MITPERRFAVVPVEPGVACAVRVPAAGHLGVIEDRCDGVNDHETVFSLGDRCPICRAAP